eukprot:m.113763 g.113763  ORF g.113763 m.113763 type:complete len:52 (-) comp16260_c0_seq4:55-210(-)
MLQRLQEGLCALEDELSGRGFSQSHEQAALGSQVVLEIDIDSLDEAFTARA